MKTCMLLAGISAFAAFALPFASMAQDAATQTPPPPPVLVPAPAPAPPGLVEKLKTANISSSVQELVRMSEAGTDPAVIQSYVDSSTTAYVPRPDEIIYMHQHGIPPAVITAMIQHGAKLREQIAQAAPTVQPTPAAPQQNPAYVVQQPAPTYVDTPTYVYSSPNVVYLPYYGSSYYCGGYYGGGGYRYFPRASFSFGFFPRFGFSHSFARVGGSFGHGGFSHGGGFHHR